MGLFSYKAVDRKGKEIKGSISGDSLSSAKSNLRSKGLMIIDIKATDSKKKSTFSLGGGKVSVEDLGLMTRQLATLLKAKVQAVEAIGALVNQVDNPVLQSALAKIKQQVSEGTSLGKALGEYPKIFDHIYVNMVEAGEASGTLEVVLLRLADFTEAQMKLKNKVKSAMTYPLIMGFFGGSMMIGIFTFVIPKIAGVFASSNKELPWQTKLSMDISDFLINKWYLALGVVMATIFVIRQYSKTASGINQIHAMYLKMPILGSIVTMVSISRFTSTLATLLRSGVPLLPALKIVKNLLGNIHMKKAIENAQESVQEGRSLTAPLVDSGLFPSMVTHMIRLGEKSGEVEEMLEIIADNYEDQVNNKLNGLTSLLEPVMMVFMGIAVGFVVFSVVVPMLDLNDF